MNEITFSLLDWFLLYFLAFGGTAWWHIWRKILDTMYE